jgi:hypothetical protein
VRPWVQAQQHDVLEWWLSSSVYKAKGQESLQQAGASPVLQMVG